MTSGPPPKKRMTPTERAVKQQAEADEKRKKAAEREEKRRQKEEADKLAAELKAQEKAARAAEKAEKENKRLEREKQKREKEEEDAKKSRSQMKLTSMFAKGQPTVKPQARDDANPKGANGNGAAKETSLYGQIFRPFFVKEHVRLAGNPSELDDETREAKTRILDEYILGDREEPARKFDPLEALQIPKKHVRGRVYPSVRKIMTEFHGRSPKKHTDLTTESQNAQIRHLTEALKSVPVKSIKFKDNVRPPYIGTISGSPPGGRDEQSLQSLQRLQKLARKPTSRDILALNYDYDSEAEWQEEEGEDVDDLEEEEEDDDMDEEMAGFLDDSEDVGPARMVLEGGMEPDSSGLCWEGHKRCTAQPEMYKYQLEFIHGKPAAGPSSEAWLANPHRRTP